MKSSAAPLAGTEGATQPFWAPDGSALAFFANGKLKKTTLAGGLPTTVCDAPDPRGGAWAPDGTIVFAPRERGPLYRVSASGGTPTPLTTLRDNGREVVHAWPAMLPGGGLLYNNRRNPGPIVMTVESGGTVRHLPLPYIASYAGGWLVYRGDSDLFARRFEAERAKVAGDPVPIVRDVARNAQLTDSPPLAAVSPSGVLAYALAGAAAFTLDLINRSGGVVRSLGREDTYVSPMFSPDGKQLAITSGRGALGGDIWIVDLARGTRLRLSYETANTNPVWSPDGRRLVYASHPKGVDEFVEVSTAGPGTRRVLPIVRGSSGFARPLDWSSDGRYIVYLTRDPGFDIWYFDTQGNGSAKPFLNSPNAEANGRLSHDGHWLAYSSDESGRNEIYVQPFPDGGAKYRVSLEGGDYPRWRGDSGEVFWIDGSDRVVSASVTLTPRVALGTPTPLFDSHIFRTGGGPFEPTSNGQHFFIQRTTRTDLDELTIVVNWPASIGK